MFHQVLINEADQNSQRFLWCGEDQSNDPNTYIMKVMTFGASCSPSCAQFVINENARRFAARYPAAVEAIQKNQYVDDLLASVDTENEAIELAKCVRLIHQHGGFEMRNWISNSTPVLEALQTSRKPEMNLDIITEFALEKVLGMWWNTTTDVFQFKLNVERNRELLAEGKHPTKREILRVLMSIYDPLGLIGNYLMFLKILLQEIWRAGTEWDDMIHEKQLKGWITWLRILPQIEEIRIPRCYHTSSCGDQHAVELHTFVDASELGYAAVSYFRFVQDGVIKCALIGAKTRVAPIKFVSIPRLELQAAVIGVRLAKSIEQGHSLDIKRRYFWTDARDVICWLNSDNRRYSQFVAFRTSEILENTEIKDWNWIPSKLNVADEGTKWQRQPDFDANSRWFNGPSFLWEHECEWPKMPTSDHVTVEEIRQNLLHHTIDFNDILRPEDHSKWKHLRRITALVIRFAENIKRKLAKAVTQTGILTMHELATAENFHYRRAQNEVYSEEMVILTKAKSIKNQQILPRKSSLYKLSPFLDDNGVMRVHSRIDVCEFVGKKSAFPIVLPRDHRLTQLILLERHERYHHQNHETYINEVRKQYYIPRLRVQCEKVRRKCQQCKIRMAKSQPPAMGNLPPARLAAFVRPFSYTGVDFFGPYNVAVGRRTEKRWGVLMTCLTIRAIHIEIAHSLNTDSCIMALKNFMARRGTPVEIFSDRGTNFVGASKELSDALKTVDKQRIMLEFTSSTTSWNFNPPASPHMGGSWERLIQSVKKILAEIHPKRSFTDEVLRNTLTEIENIVNSRPLTYVPVDDVSSPALTPNHFLLGSSNGSKPLVPYDDSAIVVKHSWKTSQILANYFWRRWVMEYLPTITRRTKWFLPAKPIGVGDIVIVVDPNMPRSCWPKGRVVATKISKDGQVRSATVQTVSGLYERPAVKLAVLDIGANINKLNQSPT
ncbi:uncharacterized protein LOC129765623 [Toxorhynchites rutilus septentrionalis]|uniref:uncharacterized protein LOC129765623 n=1 Tax=Toxorhynchites rutilus septentrionalis TaxID=329112 RepID=UPI00247AE7A8|nr:uncharacterized protein LOC129765623 [Toxorhynchites rutilus septentrionalis]